MRFPIRLRSGFIRLVLLLAGGLSLMAPAVANETITYTYDALGRLVQVARTGTVNSGASACYSYDKANNRSNVKVSTTSACGATASPSFSIADASATEGGTVQITITRSGSLTGTDTVKYATANVTAIAGSDYTAVVLTTLTFSPGVATQTVSVSTIQDALVEGNETFNVSLSSPSSGASIADGQAIGTIVDDDTVGACSGVSFTIGSNAAVTEGISSVFTVTKTGSTGSSCTVNYATANGTAVAPGDYTTASGTLTFTSAQTSKTVTVTTIDDATVESAETFAMSLSSPGSGATLGAPSSATATINDNDGVTAPSFSIDDVSAVEGNDLIFTVTKTGSTSSTFTVNYATADGTATAPGKYTATSGTLTFAPSVTYNYVTVHTVLTSLTEPDKTMYVNLSGASGGSTISVSPGTGTITDQCGLSAPASGSAPADGTTAAQPAQPASCP